MLKLLNADDYVPRTIQDIVYHSDRSREAIEEIVEGYVPFPTAGKNGIILWGVWGTGKTQLAKLIPEAFERRITGQEPWVNFITVKANGTGLAIVNEIENTTKLNFAAFGSYHYFILDEVDLLGKEGMESLKAVMNTREWNSKPAIVSNEFNFSHRDLQLRQKIYCTALA